MALSLQDVLDRVSTTRYPDGGTNTGDALEYARVNSFTSENGKRPYAAQVAIVITDGFSNDWKRTAKEAKRLRDKVSERSLTVRNKTICMVDGIGRGDFFLR